MKVRFIMNNIKVSAIIPAKNEEATIAACIESVICALNSINNSEIILVDSCSIDRTIDVAKNYPIKIYRLRNDWLKSPAAGRFIGSIKSSGEYLLFIDADMIVEKDWVGSGIRYLENDSEIAGVTGKLYNAMSINELNDRRLVKHPVGYVDYLPGAALFRKNILLEAGNFNPFMMGNEEKDIGERIRKLGYKQIRLDEKIATHISKQNSRSELDEKAKYIIGVAQYLKYNFTIESFIITTRKYPATVSTTFMLLYLILSLLFLTFLNNPYFIIVFFIIFLFASSYLVYRQRNIRKTILYLYGLISKSIGFFYGFLHRTKSPHEYPTNAEKIQ